MKNEYNYYFPEGSFFCTVHRVEENEGKRIYVLPKGLKPPYPLYRCEKLKGLPETTTIYIVEGEKCVHILEALKLVSVTSKGGAKSAGKSDWSPLARFQHIVIIPDHDEPGISYARDVTKLLNRLPGTRDITLCELPGLEQEGDDVEQFLEKCDIKDSADEATINDLQRASCRTSIFDLIFLRGCGIVYLIVK